MTLCCVKFIHKISPRDTDVFSGIEIPDNAWADKKTLAKAMRNKGLLVTGQRLRSFRVEGNRVITFPQRSSCWHCIILEVQP